MPLAPLWIRQGEELFAALSPTMNPILASGLVTLGSELIHKISSPPSPTVGEADFQALLKTEINAQPQQLTQRMTQLRQSLWNSPEIHCHLSGESSGFWVNQLDDGGFEVSSPTTGARRLPPGSMAESLARELLALTKSISDTKSVSSQTTQSIWIASN